MVMDEPRSDTGRDAPRDTPRIIVAQRVIDKIRRGALLYPEPETGEAMIGFVVPVPGRAEPDLYILDTISPGERAVREWGMFEQGDDWQGDVFHWLFVNWEVSRKQRRPSYGNALAAKWDFPLAHVGDWHKQPGDMIAPSGGDAMTARRMIEDRDTPIQHLVAPIVTLYPLEPEPPATEPATTPAAAPEAPSSDVLGQMVARTGATPPEVAPGDEAPAGSVPALAETPPQSAASEPVAPEKPVEPPPSPNAIVLRDREAGWTIRIDFWYMSKRRKHFVPAVPEIWADDRLPGLAPIAWHLAHPRRFQQEYGLLRDAGYAVDMVRWDADGRLPYEICFQVYRPGATHVLLLVTSHDYPYDKPSVRLAPLVSVAEDEDLFEKLYDASRPLPEVQMPAWEWDSKRTLLELAQHVEQTQSATPPPPKALDAPPGAEKPGMQKKDGA